MAMGNPLEFIIRTTVTPEVTLGDYKKIAAGIPLRPAADNKVSEKEITEALDRIKKSHMDEHHGHDVGQEQGDHDHAAFDTPEFKEKIKEALVAEKERVAREKRRIEIAEKINDASTIELPAILVDSELRRAEAQFNEDMARMGTTVADYLASAKKTIADLRAEWRPKSEKKVKLQLILNKIADLEKIIVEAKEIEAETAHIMEHYKDADREQAALYAAGVLSNEKVFHFLEGQKESK
jgi:FKBP-type peptidyl-prolyl cis-trans isomerase (trigger factor)